MGRSWQALHEVVIAQNMEIIEFLLKECSASPTIKDNTGLSPMQMSFGPRMKSFMSKYGTYALHVLRKVEGTA